MTLSFLLPAVWGMILLVAFIGYGKLLSRFLFADETSGWANQAAWGMALFIVIGGWLNLFYLISAPLLLLLIAGGVIFCLFETFRQRNQLTEFFTAISTSFKEQRGLSMLKAAGLISIITLIAIQYLGSVTLEVHHYNYITMDDLRGYFLFPKQMLEAGGITADPFNFMRLGNGLGGQAILHALMLAVFDFFNIFLIETGISLIICVGLIWQIAQKRGLSFLWRWLLAALFLCLPYYPTLVINSSSFVSGMLMLLALFAFLDRDEIPNSTPVQNALIIGILAASATALKTTFLPPVAVSLVLSYLYFLFSLRFSKKAVLETTLVPFFTLIILLPWMLSLYNSSGTLLYHILGTGFDEYNYGNYINDMQVGGFTFKEKLTFIYLTYFSRDIYLLLIIGTTTCFILTRLRQRAATHAFALGVLLAAIILLLKVDVTKTVSLHRYLFGGIFIALLIVIMELMSLVSAGRKDCTERLCPRWFFNLPAKARVNAVIAILIGMGGLFFWPYGYGEKVWSLYQFYLNILPDKMASQGVFFPEDWRTRYLKGQQTVPEGATILSRDTFTASYDFSRNEIYSFTLPGACSPPPGLPYFTGPDKITDYLLSHDIRYLAYTYASDGGLPIAQNIYRIRPDAGYFNRIYQRATMALDTAFKELGGQKKRLYDDGSLFILDLQRPATAPRDYQAPNYFQREKILTPAVAKTTGFGRNKIWTNGHGVIKGIHYQRDTTDRLLALNTFGYHPWKGDMQKLRLTVSVNGRPLPYMGYRNNSYFFSLTGMTGPMTRISIDSTTFVPREEGVRFGKDDDSRVLGIDVDTIEIKASPQQFL